MRRIQQSHEPEQQVDSFKPLFPSKSSPPFYDPRDLHTHIWKKGKLGIEDNPKIPTYSKTKLSIRDCTYCKICHMIHDSFQSTIGSNRDIVEDIITIIAPDKPSEYIIIPAKPKINEQLSINTTLSNQSCEYGQIRVQGNKLYHKIEGIFDDYVVVEDN